MHEVINPVINVNQITNFQEVSFLALVGSAGQCSHESARARGRASPLLHAEIRETTRM